MINRQQSINMLHVLKIKFISEKYEQSIFLILACFVIAIYGSVLIHFKVIQIYDKFKSFSDSPFLKLQVKVARDEIQKCLSVIQETTPNVKTLVEMLQTA